MKKICFSLLLLFVSFSIFSQLPINQINAAPMTSAMKTFGGHGEVIYDVKISPMGDYIVSCSNELRVHQLKNQKLVTSVKSDSWAFQALTFSEDGKYFATASLDYKVKLWQANNCQLVKTFEGHSWFVYGVALSADGKRIASASSGGIEETDPGQVKVWDVATGSEVFDLKGHKKDALCVAYSKDGKYLASGSVDKNIIIWNAETGSKVREIRAHAYAVTGLAFSPDGKYLASCSKDKSVKVWEVESGVSRGAFYTPSEINSVSYSRNGKYIAAGLENSNVKVWLVTERDGYIAERVLRTFTEHKEAVTGVDFTPDSQYVISSSKDKTMKLWSIKK